MLQVDACCPVLGHPFQIGRMTPVILVLSALVLVPSLGAQASSSASLGHIYALTSNGTTNCLNLLDVDLTSWGIRVGPSLAPSVDTAEQAAAFDNGTFWTDTFDDFGAYIVGFDVSTMEVAYSLNISTWPLSGGFLFIDGIFVTVEGDLLVAGNAGCNAQGCGDEQFYRIADPKGKGVAAHIGSLPFGGVADVTFDPVSSSIFFILGEGSETSSGVLLGVEAPPGGVPEIVANITLQDFFAWPQWDAGSQSVFGLSLYRGPAALARNVTFLAVPPGETAFNATTHGTIPGGYYVSLEDGPKAFDPVSRRCVGAFAEEGCGRCRQEGVRPLVSPPRFVQGFLHAVNEPHGRVQRRGCRYRFWCVAGWPIASDLETQTTPLVAYIRSASDAGRSTASVWIYRILSSSVCFWRGLGFVNTACLIQVPVFKMPASFRDGTGHYLLLQSAVLGMQPH